MDDDDVLCRFGTALEPLEEDEVPSKKKPIAVEDQIVTDKNGRRRFHGAFTGGFSAGFWNTVGSLEGWKPQNFKSSRAEKADRYKQSASDFMDEEDLGEFGIAPQRVQATSDFAKEDAGDAGKKRKLQQKTEGPIPGIPVLNQLLEPAREKVAVRLLKRMGWKPGQGVGARQTRKEKKVAGKRNERERYLMQKYGCDMGPLGKEAEDGSESDLSDNEEVTFAPDDFEPFICVIKDNSFGLGYQGLSREPVLSKYGAAPAQHVNLFGPLEVLGKNNQKLSIRGQAFGVGALEEEDDDIYARDDMSKYDFSLEKKKKEKSSKSKLPQDKMVIDGFEEASKNPKHSKKVFVVSLPEGFAPRNWAQRRTRFEPLDEQRATQLKVSEGYKARGLGRHDLNPEQRGSILGETSRHAKKEEVDKDRKKSYLDKVNEKYKKTEKSQSILDLISRKSANFTKGEVLKDGKEIIVLDESAKQENEKVQQEAEKITKDLPSTSSSVFKPFAGNEEKQIRYDKFVDANLKGQEEYLKFLSALQPLHMSEWDREMELKEFVQAKNMFKPLKGIMSDRFVTEVAVIAERENEKPKLDKNKKLVVQRTKAMWKPASLLCKRFNIPEPFGGGMVEEMKPKKKKFSVFDYLEHSMNRKEDFVTPVIIPKHVEKVLPVVEQTFVQKVPDKVEEKKAETGGRMSAKEFFADNDDHISGNKEIKRKEVANPIVKQKPKTELEQQVEDRKKQHPAEKKDLFKAIFESSDEEGEEEEPKPQSEAIPADIVASLTKPAAEVNILRNTSPPRGIFAALFGENAEKKKEEEKLQLPPKIAFQPKEKRLAEDMYGPQLPQKVDKPEKPPAQVDVDARIVDLLKKTKENSKIVEEWVEKKDVADKKQKKSKKSNKEKHKKKKKRRSSSSESDCSSSESESDDAGRRGSKKHKKDKKKKKKRKK